MPEKLGAYSGGIRAATSQFSGAGEGGPKLVAFEADVTNNACLDLSKKIVVFCGRGIILSKVRDQNLVSVSGV